MRIELYSVAMVRTCNSSHNVGGMMRTASNTGTLPKTVFDNTRQGVLGIFVLTFLMIALLGACASMPRAMNYDGEPQQVEPSRGAPEQVEARRCTDVCWVMSARNDNYFEAWVYIRGQRVATLPGMMAKDVPIPIRSSMLDGGGCMVVFVKLYPDTKTAYSSEACPVPGSRLELAVAESYGEHALQLWLQDWRTR